MCLAIARAENLQSTKPPSSSCLTITFLALDLSVELSDPETQK